jgi:transcription-repair coupling factor (superfamily II helicase)
MYDGGCQTLSTMARPPGWEVVFCRRRTNLADPVSSTLADLARDLAAGPVTAFGLSPAYAAHAAAELAAGGAIVAVVPDEAAARRMASDLAAFLPPLPDADPAAPPVVLRIPGPDVSPYAEMSPDRGALHRRMAALFRLGRGGALAPRAVVVSAGSLIRKVPPPGELAALAFELRRGATLDRDGAVRALLAAGYGRVPVVDDPGGFAVRGGVIDVFPPLYGFPVRLELDGDEIELLRSFDPATQRTLRDLDRVWIHPVRETVATGGADPRARILDAADRAHHPSKETRRILELVADGGEFVGVDTLSPAFHARMAPLADYLPPDALWLIVDPDGVRRAASDEREAAERRYGERLDDHKLAFPPGDFYVDDGELAAQLAAPPRRLEAPSLEVLGHVAGAAHRVELDDLGALRSALERARATHADELMRPLTSALAGFVERGHRIALACGSATRADRLAALLADYGVVSARADHGVLDLAALPPAVPTVVRARLSHSFAAPAEALVVITDDDVFGGKRAAPPSKPAAKRAKDALFGGVTDFSQLAPGDFVVHQLHGVGRYQGLVKLPVAGGLPLDFLHLEYDGGTLYLPVYRLGELGRHVGAEGHSPRVDKLGGVTWEKTKRKVSAEVRALAEELLQLYAQRAALPGHGFPPSDAVFREFEATFPFDETPDQQSAIDEVIADMETPRPMDRLVCGDVGYGKTEVALRAILKCVLGGKQAAFLAPTTVLVEQHYQTMASRFAGWPIKVARLSRFQSRADQIKVVRELAEGRLDAVVGTHRLLSNDVRWKDLGLLVIDEEQRFGVAHKERLKKARTQLDVLTLTATPIPRTLHLSMSGLRDLSIIATPPADRRAVRTVVATPDDGVLREAIQQELARGGQCFFVAPRIGSGVPRKRGPSPSTSTSTSTSTLSANGEPTLEEWAERLRGLVPGARVAVGHGQMAPEALEKVMVDFVSGRADILVSTTIVESGLDIPRANTLFVARADVFGLAQLYQLRGRVGRSKERAYCYLLVPPPETLTDDARRRLEAMQRYTELGSGFAIASHDLEIRGAGELLGARQSGAIAAVGTDTYAELLEEAVAELRGEEIVRPRDPELNVEAPGYIPDDYVPDTAQRLDLYKRLAGADDGDEVKALLDEIVDRYGPLPREVSVLADLMELKALARRLRAQSLELTSRSLTLALPPDTPLSAARVMELVKKARSPYRLTPDMRLQRSFDAGEATAPAQAARAVLLELVACAT